MGIKRFTFILIGVILVWVLYVGIRSEYFYHQTGKLALESSQFKTDYSVGSGKQTMTITVLGDSTAAGTGASSLEHSFPYLVSSSIAEKYKVKVIVKNYAYSGAKIADLVSTQLPKVQPSNYILISVGANDGTHFTSLDSYKSSVDTLINYLKTLPNTTVLYANSPDMNLTPAIPTAFGAILHNRLNKENDILQTALAGSAIGYIDLFNKGKLDGYSFYASDRFHPNNDGYAVWANLFTSKL